MQFVQGQFQPLLGLDAQHLGLFGDRLALAQLALETAHVKDERGGRPECNHAHHPIGQIDGGQRFRPRHEAPDDREHRADRCNEPRYGWIVDVDGHEDGDWVEQGGRQQRRMQGVGNEDGAEHRERQAELLQSFRQRNGVRHAVVPQSWTDRLGVDYLTPDACGCHVL